MNNTRNDIATGTTDPYKVGNQSGIAYSPQELKAIENAYAGIYDPAINDVFSRLKEREDEEKARQAQESKKSDFDNELALMDRKFGYDSQLKTMGGSGGGSGGGGGLFGPNSFKEWTLAGGLEGTGKTYAQHLSGENVGASYLATTASQGKVAIANMLAIANSSKEIFGRTASLPVPDFARSNAFRNYRAQLEFLKGNIIPAAVTAMREASKTGGALGQVSDKEGAFLAASLGALEMNQSPEQVILQLQQINSSLSRWEDSVQENQVASSVLKSPDGTQEVSVADLTPEELQEAQGLGWQ